jgi:hypothetical protein
MTSYILGRIEIDDVRMASDIAALRKLEKSRETYDEFTTGFWKNIPLWNESGNGADGIFRDARPPARPTEYAALVPYVSEMIEQNFAVEHLSMVRARDIVDSSMMPHKDFLELESTSVQNFRVLMVLEDNPNTFNSDEGKVFRMRKGEVWFLDAAGIHCAANFSADSRVSVCLDFSLDHEFAPSDIFADAGMYAPVDDSLIIDRKRLPNDFEASISAMSPLLNRHNFREFAFAFGKLHFTFDVPIGQCYDWLIDMAGQADDPALVGKAKEAKNFFVLDRSMHERFSFTSW